ncbi:MAG: hypothetical protein A6F71_04885 [Cycloclasticus sp. symbiont of Poecilosclerida sp. M]|nr:MAG: hypothetical protein A6F71_04885 [Cycloclasticus sp. symbiont of Poecilosclerida sp. M]
MLSQALMVGCSSKTPFVQDAAPSSYSENLHNIPDAVPKVEPRSRGGNPASYEVFGKTYHVMTSNKNFVQRGSASWYGTKFHGNKTSNGETYNMYAMTAAHKTLPIPTYLQVHNLNNGKKIIVRVNDRGPFHGGRIVDLSYAAAIKLGVLKTGTAPVEIRALDPNNYQATGTTVTYAAPTKPNFYQADSPVKNSPHPQQNKTTLYIQVGSFSELKNAEKFKSRISAHGIYNIRLAPEQRNGTPLYRVQLGPFASLQTADSMKFRLQQLDIFNSHYVRY